MPDTIKALLDEAVTQLKPLSDSADIDARILLSHCIEQSQTYLYTWPDHSVTDEQLSDFKQLIDKRIQGQPIAYLTGLRSFWTMDLKVTKDTLIPRSETELLVEACLERMPNDVSLEILDMGTGSGAIAISLALERSKSNITATDISKDVLKVAHFNAKKYNLKNCQFTQSSWYESIDRNPYDIIVSNPPYIETQDSHLKQGDVRFEPDTALISGIDGLDDIRIIIHGATQYLKPSGYLLLEHGWNQAERVRKLLSEAGFSNIKTLNDLNDKERVTLAQQAHHHE